MFGTHCCGQQFTGLLAREGLRVRSDGFQPFRKPYPPLEKRRIGFPEPFLIFIYLGDSARCDERPRAPPFGIPPPFEKGGRKLVFCFNRMQIQITIKSFHNGEFISPPSSWIEVETPRRIGRGASPPAASSYRRRFAVGMKIAGNPCQRRDLFTPAKAQRVAEQPRRVVKLA